MKNKIAILKFCCLLLSLLIHSCAIPKITQKNENKTVPVSYDKSTDTVNSANIKWKDFFKDPLLIDLIETALANNQEFNIVKQEILLAQNEVLLKKGTYLPFVNVGGASGIDRVSRYTSQGAADAVNEITPGNKVPENLPDFMVGISASWEVDIWRKLRNARDAASKRYLASVEGRKFLQTQLISEIAGSYYELITLDNMLVILKQYIEIQENALSIVRQQKIAARVTELAVRRFEAEVLKNKSRLYYIQQEIVEISNRINFLTGRFTQPVIRSQNSFESLKPDTIFVGIPSQLLRNRPDILKAELELSASKIDIKVAKAEFYPSLRITSSLGLRAFNPAVFFSPESIIYSLIGDLAGPIINRKALKAEYLSANVRQTQAVYNFERSILNAMLEVSTQLAKIENITKSYSLKSQQVDALNESIDISTNLFKSAKADYMEVLLTQRDALEAKMELVETKKQQMTTWVQLYRTLGGGWQE